MIGKIRTREICPKCHSPFSFNETIGFLCQSCLTVPKRLLIDFRWNKKRIRIFSDKTGQVLDTYERAKNFQFRIYDEIENGTFNPSKYIRTQLRTFWVSNLLDDFWAEKKKTIRPSYLPNYKVMIDTAKAFFGNDDVRELRKVDTKKYQTKVEERGLSGKSVKNYMDHFKTFLNWCRTDPEVVTAVPPFPQIEIQETSFAWVEKADQAELFGAVHLRTLQEIVWEMIKKLRVAPNGRGSHAFRHTVIMSMLREAHIDPGIVGQIAGNTPRTIYSNYSSQVSIDEQSQAENAFDRVKRKE